MEALSHYLDELSTHLPRDERLRGEILAEVADHLRQRAAAWRSQGLSEEESARRAVDRFGPPGEVGEALARVHRGGSWPEAVAGGLPHLLAGLTLGLPALALAFGGPYLGHLRRPLEWALGAAVVAVLALWGRRRSLWVHPWIGYGLLLALGLAMTAADRLGLLSGPGYHGVGGALVWLVPAGLTYLWLAGRDRLGAVLAAAPIATMLGTLLFLDEVIAARCAPLVVAIGLALALATAAAIRLGDERRGLLLVVAAHAIVGIPVQYQAIYLSPYPAILVCFAPQPTPLTATVSAAVALALSTLLLVGPLWFHATVHWLGRTVRRDP